MAENTHIWAEKAGELRNALAELRRVPVPKVLNRKLSSLREEAAEDMKFQDRQKEGVKKYILETVDSSPLPLTELARECRTSLMNDYPDLCISFEEIAALIVDVASRKSYGLSEKNRNRLEDAEPGCLWVWQLYDHLPSGDVTRERKLLGKELKTLSELVQALDRTYIEPDTVSSLYEAFLRAAKDRDKYYREVSERKRKKEAMDDERNAKRMKLETNKQLKKEEKNAKKQERLEKAEAEKQARDLKRQEELERKQKILDEKRQQQEEKRKQLEEKRLKQLEEKQSREKAPKAQEKKPKLDEKPESKISIDPITKFYKIERREQEPIESTDQSELEPMKIEGEQPEDWKAFWKSQAYRPVLKRQTFIWIHDSALKPYFLGKPASIGVRRDFLKLISEVDYDRDSEEEFEEQNAEDLGEEDVSSDEESEASDESAAEFVVPDNYLSDNEGSADERIEIRPRSHAVEPLTIFTPEQLLKLSVLAPSGMSFPIEIVPPHVNAKDEDWLPDLLRIVQGKASKTEVLNALRDKHPSVSARAVNMKLGEVAVKLCLNGAKKQYYLKENIPEPRTLLPFVHKPESSS